MFKRFRRTRINPKLRDLLAQTKLSTDDFIYPLFIKAGEKNYKKEIASMPGVFQMGIDEVIKECDTLKKLGLYSIILFELPEALTCAIVSIFTKSVVLSIIK